MKSLQDEWMPLWTNATEDEWLAYMLGAWWAEYGQSRVV